MPSELTIITIIDSKSRKAMKLQGKWSEVDVRILLNDGVSSWTGDFRFDEISEDVLSQLELNHGQFVERMKEALGTALVNSKFKYSLENDALSWSKIITPEFSVEYDKIPLKPVAAASQGELVKSLLDSYGAVLEELSQSVARYNRLEEEYQQINSAFENSCRIKNEIENSLYTKFALILNEKKEYVKRVTGEYPRENFAPTPHAKVANDGDLSRNIKTVTSKDFSKMFKRNSKSCERPSKKQMLDPQPGTSRNNFEDMET